LFRVRDTYIITFPADRAADRWARHLILPDTRILFIAERTDMSKRRQLVVRVVKALIQIIG